MEQWVRDTFRIVKPFPFTNEEYIVVDEKTMVYLPMFFDYVNGLSTPLTVDKLKSVDPDDSRRWFSFFDEWQQQGLIS